MKLVLFIAGALVMLLGLHWIGQGTGYFPWPNNPAMDDHIIWAYFGGAAVALGLAIVWFARR